MDLQPGEHLSSDAVWNDIIAQIKAGKFDALLAGPPCNSFTNARKDDGMGPMPLRGPTGDDRYGLKNLDPKDAEKVKTGTLLALRAHEASTLFHGQEKPFILEQPKWKRDDTSVSMFNLDEYQDLLSLPGVRTEELVQCEYGAETSKPTTLIVGHVDETGFKRICTHAARRWRRPSTGERHWGAHPPLKGKEWYVHEEKWKPHMLRTPREIAKQERGLPFLTSAAQAYPGELNNKLCEVLLDDIKQKTKTPIVDDMVLTGRWKNVLKRRHSEASLPTVKAKVDFTVPLKGKRRRIVDRDEEDDNYLGGMRKPRSAAARIPGYRQAGIVVYRVLMRHLRRDNDLYQKCLQSISSDAPDAGPSEEQLGPLRSELRMSLSDVDISHCKPALDSKLQADILWQIARAAGDPDGDCIYEWLTEGAPAGISKSIEDPGRIFPPDHEEEIVAEQYLPDHFNHKNYTSVDEDEAAAPEVERLINTGFVESFSTHQQLSEWLGGRPHLSKLGMITKEKDGKTKRRLILDCKESGVNKKASGGGRLLLPRVTDIVDDALYLMS